MGSTTLRIRLLGEFDLRRGEDRLPPFDSVRAESLLAYLLLHRDTPQSRQRLSFLLWPDSTEPQARTNLRHVLHNLRRALPEFDQYVDVTPRTLQWRADTPFWLDVAAFDESISRAEREGPDGGLDALRDAVELYTGDLLEGSYDEWVLGERERLRGRYIDALERLGTLLEAHGEHNQAIQYAERLLRHDPLHEETYRLLMRLHDARGERARALRVYHVCTTTLERELGVEPSTATREAYEALLHAEGEQAVVERQAGRAGGPPIVGRVPEMARLMALWRATERGRSQLVLVTGEPGIGKSRLVEEFRSRCVHRGALTAEARSYPAEGALAYAPLVAWLRAEGIYERLARLSRAHLVELARLLPELRSSAPNLAQPEPLPGREQRQRLFDAAARAILASGRPLLLVADDLHWCDEETLQFLHYLLRIEPDARLLVAATARREDVDSHHPLNDLLAGLQALDRCTEIQVEPLTQGETATLAEWIAGRPLEERAVDPLFRETEGNPLFVVEALRAGWTSAHGAETPRRWMSPRVQAAIESRLTQLTEPSQDLVGVAATIGREFTIDVLTDASKLDEELVVRGLDELWRRRIFREQGTEGYDFSHDKIREVAYLGLSPARRRRHHLHVALALERLHAHDPGPVSGQIAAHYECAGSASEAVTWYGQAAEAAQHLYANANALRLLDRALDLLRTLPDTPERQTRELAVLTAQLGPLGVIEGWASARLSAVQARAVHLVRALGVEPVSTLLRSLAIACLSQRDFERARDFGEQLRARGERDADDMLFVEGDYVLGIAAFWQGEFNAARRHFESAVDRYRPEHRRAHLLAYGLDPKVVCLSRLGNTLWFLGYRESAIRARDAALALSDEIGHPFSHGVALVFAAMLSLELHDVDDLRAYAAMLTASDGEHETRPSHVAGEAIRGYLDVLDGQEVLGIHRIQQALDETGAADHAPGMRAQVVRVFLAACAVAGDSTTGLAAADRALVSSDADRLWEAEVRRLRAEFLVNLDSPNEDVEAELQRAIAVARRQGAMSLELRAATDLLRYRLAHGGDPGTNDVRELLTAIVAGIPEGRDNRELREATAILGQS